MEQRPFEDRRRQVGEAAGVLVEGRLIGQEVAGCVQTEAVVGGVGVPLAGDPQVVAPVEPESYRPAGVDGGQRRAAGPFGGLVLLAAEAAAQPGDVDLDGAHRQAGDPGDRRLGGAGRLG